MLYEFKFKRGECVFKVFTILNWADEEEVKCVVVELSGLRPQEFTNMMVVEDTYAICETFQSSAKLTIARFSPSHGVENVLPRHTLQTILEKCSLNHISSAFEPIFAHMPLQENGLFLGHDKRRLRARTHAIWKRILCVALAWNRWRRHTMARIYHPSRMKRCIEMWASDELERRPKRQCLRI